ncbi:MAG: hypothetical protein A2Y25_03735 [Candidatus Melainabacteria bacterium GWF2_37_15]|nr:MAG: hypothetical protein A2Y25_03735 [Candidatus Melainabacteria bacterium GWF2_37_15]
MLVKTLTLGFFSCNNYLVMCEDTNDAVLIDAGGDYEATMQEVRNSNANLKYIFHTHGHLDHISGDVELKAKAGVKVFIHKGDQFLVEKFKDQLMMFGLPDMEIPVIDEHVDDGQVLEVGKLKFKVIHTPGHSPGSVCYLVDDVLFSGDTLFRDSVGRTDLYGGSYEQIGESIKNKLFTLDESIKVYPGHGSPTSIGYEKENNPFFGKNTTL